MSDSGFVNVAEIGTAAVRVWEFLHQHGPTSVHRMASHLDLTRDVLLQAIGWLAREDKLCFQRASRGRLIGLK